MKRLLIIQQIGRETPGLFIEIALELNLDYLIIHPYLGERIPIPTKEDCLLVLGGPMGINDIGDVSYPWLSDELITIKYSLEKGIPIIGVCLGAQFLALVAGGNVVPITIGNPPIFSPEVGWSPIHKAKTNEYCSLQDNLENPLDVLHWHGDKICLPKHATLLASTSYCHEQLFKINCRTYGLQFHAEILENDFFRWIKEDKRFIELGLGANGVEYLVEQHNKYYLASLEARKEFLKVLVNLVRSPEIIS